MSKGGVQNRETIEKCTVITNVLAAYKDLGGRQRIVVKINSPCLSTLSRAIAEKRNTQIFQEGKNSRTLT